VEQSSAFFLGLDDAERKYLRRDVTSREVIEERISDALQHKLDRIVALHHERIVADGSLEPERFQWAGGIAEIRIIVARDFRRVGLGLLIARELYALAHLRAISRLNARMMAPQLAARAIFRKLGFSEEFVIPKHVKDRDGKWQDLVVMRCELTTPGAEAPAPTRIQDDEKVAEVELLEKLALRWAVLAAWEDELARRQAKVSLSCAKRLEETRIKIASGCFGSCHIGCLLSEIESELVSIDGTEADCKVDTWIDLLRKSMTEPNVVLGFPAVQFRYANCGLIGRCECGVKKHSVSG
jgi:RimJ/RimL family protein N-acetyltransferase